MKIFITGSSGFVGRHLKKFLKDKAIVTATNSKNCDLTKPNTLKKFKKKYDIIFHLAAWIQPGNLYKKQIGDQWIINQKINTHLLDWWSKNQKQCLLVILGSSGVYNPKKDYVENNYLDSVPNKNFYTYASTKKMLYLGVKSLSEQYNLKYLCFIPPTIYGKNYYSKSGQQQFIFDLIKKIIIGKIKNKNVILWGDGSQKREIVDVEDFIKNMWKIIKLKINNEIFNIGYGKEFTIKYYAKLISKIIKFNYNNIKYDKTIFPGSKSNLLNLDKIKKKIKLSNKNLKRNILNVITWYSNEYFPKYKKS
jgi:GDP-L-fucose synthase